jgi:predicted CopG family antitoxin
MQSTSIRIRSDTRDSLSRLKKHPRESFDDVISRLINSTVDDEPLSEETIQNIEKSLKEYREGIYYTHEDILADLGVAEETDKKYPGEKKEKED